MYRENRAPVGGPCLCQNQAWGTSPACPLTAMWGSGQGFSRVVRDGMWPVFPVCARPSKHSSWLPRLTTCSLGQSGTPDPTVWTHPVLEDLDFVLWTVTQVRAPDTFCVPGTVVVSTSTMWNKVNQIPACWELMSSGQRDVHPIIPGLVIELSVKSAYLSHMCKALVQSPVSKKNKRKHFWYY